MVYIMMVLMTLQFIGLGTLLDLYNKLQIEVKELKDKN